MTAVPPPGPELARARWRAFMGIFAILAATSVIGGYVVVRESRARALKVDAALRVAAWGLLCYASEERAWPASAEDFAEWAKGRVCCAGGWSGEGWPSAAPADCTQLTISQALEMSAVSCDPEGAGPPKLSGGGKPSSVGTLDLVNGWIKARADAGFVAHSAP